MILCNKSRKPVLDKVLNIWKHFKKQIFNNIGILKIFNLVNLYMKY